MTPDHSYMSYPIGIQGQPWGPIEKSQWLAQQQHKRSYQQEVVSPLNTLFEHSSLQKDAELFQYGELNYQHLQLGRYPLYAVRNRQFDPQKPLMLVTGGVHGYETSGVQGALQFISQHFSYFSAFANLLVLPCISPWAYETINRWNPETLDPNRNFTANSPCAESAAVFQLLQQLQTPVCMHIDLHETTDSDNHEFRPAKAARDGVQEQAWDIPDGFYLVADSEKSTPEFQQAIIDAVRKVTHIAEADEHGYIIGAPLQQCGVIAYPKKQLALCGGLTDAAWVTTTEVYPDSHGATPTQCNQAQVAAICAAIDFVLRHTQE